MIKGVIIKKLEKHSDERGWLAEFFRRDELDFRPAMGYASATLPGIVRGPHEHKKQSDYFVFLAGKFELYLWDNRPKADNYRQREILKIDAESPTAVLVPPGVGHAYKCVSETPGLMVNIPDALYGGKKKKGEIDEVRWEGRDDSPFNLES